ncbi:hypothetical protein ACFQLX_07710 [Streptomyces polyrhachis]|uniref:Lipoprotein n=1 Tax=Streptomyces polyrhachis TaxID=1282885 RepID=A0ABW2GBF1_9ACTN
MQLTDAPAVRTRRAPALLLAVAALTALTAGCSSDGGGDGAKNPLPQGTPTTVSSKTLAYPVEPYFLTTDQARRLESARIRLIEDCMGRFGFDYRAPAADPAAADGADGAEGDRSLAVNGAFRYGLTDEQAARTRGFRSEHPTPDKPDAPQLSESEELVMGGTAPLTADGKPGSKEKASYQGREIPPGGCFGEAQVKLMVKGGVFGDIEAARRIDAESMAKSRLRPEVKKAIGAWSACLKEQGFTSGDPLDPTAGAKEFQTPAPTAREIKLATADVTCKKRTNLVGVWYAAEARIQQSLIEKHAEELDAGRTAHEEMLTKAAEVLKG